MHQSHKNSQSQQKNEQFKNQIRARMRDNHMRKIRNQFLKLEENFRKSVGKSARVNENYTAEDLMKILDQPSDKNNIQKINRILIDKANELNYTHFEKLFTYITVNFINRQTNQLLNKVQLNALIALLANLLFIQKQQQIINRYINSQRVVDKVFDLIKLSQNQSIQIILWVLFKVIQLFPNHVQRVAQVQIALKQKFSASNIYLSYIILCIAEHKPDMLHPDLIQEYIQVPITRDTDKNYYENLTIIFNVYLQNIRDKNTSNGLQISILKWSCHYLMSKQIQMSQKQNLLVLLHTIVNFHGNIAVSINFVNQSMAIYELVCYSMYNTKYSSKLISVQILNNLIMTCPDLQLQQLLTSNTLILQAIVSWLSLKQHKVVIATLKSLCKIIMRLSNNKQIKNALYYGNFRIQLQVLQASKNKQISLLVSSIISDYFQ